ncbi:MAG: alpha-amylase family glycosyl hydrolase [Actinomycetota bacterium]
MQPWWREAVTYQIYPRSFADSNGDGIGDLQGILDRLEYLEWLGVDCLWLTPIYPSPMADFSYDVANYTDVEPLFGDLSLFDRLLAEVHDRGMRLILDWVPNHTSIEHPWFEQSRSSRTSPYRDFYVWRDGAAPGIPPNNWVRAWADEPAWTYDSSSEQWYLHCFLPEQPDLNWANPAVREAMHDTLRFWLDRGVDGFRMDVIHLLAKDPDLSDDPEELKVLSHVVLNHQEGIHEILKGIRGAVKEYEGDPMMVGEVYLIDAPLVATYYGNGDELDLAFNFEPMFRPWRAEAWREIINRVIENHDHRDAWPTWVLNNHDAPRIASRLRSSERAAAAAVLLLTLRGTPFLFQGEELGLENAVLGDGEVIDPGFRDGARAPIPWDATSTHGWNSAAPWMGFPPNASEKSVEAERSDPQSMLSMYRAALELRKGSEALKSGGFRWLDCDERVLAYERVSERQVLRILINFSHDHIEVSDAGDLLFSTGRDHAEGFNGQLRPDEAVILAV